jgi:DNA-binding NarL/FixJ family response regulator
MARTAATTSVGSAMARREVPGLPILVLSQHVEQLYARYLLKDRVFSDDDLTGALRRVAAGGTAMDPEVISHLVAHRPVDDPLSTLTPREVDVLRLLAEGRSNAAIASGLNLSISSVNKYVNGVFGKLHLEQSDDDNRRVRAALAYLRAES